MLGTRVTFPSRGKSPKARQGLPPFGIPPVRKNRPLWCCAKRLHPGCFLPTKKDRFATLRWWANRSCFFPQATPGGSHPQLSIRGAAGRFSFCILPGVAPLSGESNACVAGGMIMPPKGSTPEGVAPSGRFFGDFLIGEKVTRGAALSQSSHDLAERPLWGVQRGASPSQRSWEPPPLGREKNYSSKKIRRPRHLGKLAAALPPVREKPLHLPPEGGAVVVM